jgi:hypothetical protein
LSTIQGPFSVANPVPNLRVTIRNCFVSLYIPELERRTRRGAVAVAACGGGAQRTAMKKLRIVILSFGTS